MLCNPLLRTFQIQKSRIQQPPRLQISHGREDILLQMWKLLLQPSKNLAQRAAHSAGSLRAAAGHNRRSERLRIRGSDILGDENQRPDEPELAIAGMRHWRQRAELAREHSVAQ